MRVALFYFFYLGINGLLIPYFPKYLNALKFSGFQISTVNSIPPVLLMFVPLIWGFVADRTGRTVAMLKVAAAGVLLSLLCLVALQGAETFAGIMGVWMIYSFFSSPMLPLTDTVALVEARRIGTDYARLRLWGSISFILVSFAFGQYLAAGGSIQRVPLTALCLAGLAAVTAHALKQREALPHRVPPSFKDARRLASDPALMIFLIANMIHQAALSPYYLFYGIHLENRGIGPACLAWSFPLGVSAEVIMFWFIRPLLKRKPLFPLMAASFAISVARWYLVSKVENAALMACLQIAHAFTFALCYAGSIAHLESCVPEPLRATGRALYSAISQGLGSVLGYSLAGLIKDAYGTSAAFQVAALLDVIAIIPLLIAAKAYSRKQISREAMDA